VHKRDFSLVIKETKWRLVEGRSCRDTDSFDMILTVHRR